MGTHSNYVTIEGDTATAIFTVVVFAILFLSLVIVQYIRNKKADKAAKAKRRKEIKTQFLKEMGKLGL